MVRSAVAVLAAWLAYVVGYFVLFTLLVIAGVDFTAPSGVLLAVGGVAALLIGAGALSAWIAAHHPVRHALALGILLTEGGLVFALAFGGDQPFLARFGFLALIVPLTTLGGLLAARKLAASEEAPCPTPSPSPS